MWTAKHNIWTHKCFEPFVQSPLTYNKEAQQMKAICRMIELLISLSSVSKLLCILCEYTIKFLMLTRQITELICLCPIHWSQALSSEWRAAPTMLLLIWRPKEPRHVIMIHLTDCPHYDYRKTSSISRTKFQNLNVSCILMQLSSLNSLKPGVKLIMMLLEQRRQTMLQLHLSYQQFYCLLRYDLY